MQSVFIVTTWDVLIVITQNTITTTARPFLQDVTTRNVVIFSYRYTK